MAEDTWYQELRFKWKPDRVRLLLIGESPPDDGGVVEKRRFFYSNTVARADNLFRGVVTAMYGVAKLSMGESKEPWLQRLKADGVYLIDLAEYPVNGLSNRDRANGRRLGVVSCVQSAVNLEPAGIIVCHAPTFALIRKPLSDEGLPLLHQDSIPFPLGNKRAEFVERVRAALNMGTT